MIVIPRGLALMQLSVGDTIVYTVNVTDRTVRDTDLSPYGIMRARMRFLATGRLQFRRDIQDGSWTGISGQWLDPLNTDVASVHQVRVSSLNVTGNPDALVGTVGSWLSCGVDRQWYIEDNDAGLSTWDIFIEVRSNTGPVLDTASWNLQVEGIV